MHTRTDVCEGEFTAARKAEVKAALHVVVRTCPIRAHMHMNASTHEHVRMHVRTHGLHTASHTQAQVPDHDTHVAAGKPAASAAKPAAKPTVRKKQDVSPGVLLYTGKLLSSENPTCHAI